MYSNGVDHKDSVALVDQLLHYHEADRLSKITSVAGPPKATACLSASVTQWPKGPRQSKRHGHVLTQQRRSQRNAHTKVAVKGHMTDTWQAHEKLKNHNQIEKQTKTKKRSQTTSFPQDSASKKTLFQGDQRQKNNVSHMST